MRYAHWAILFLTAGPADAAPPTFVVENKVPPAFTVTNRIPTVTNKAAPAKTYRTFQDANGQWWQVETAPEVAAPVRPFPGTSDTTRDTSARSAVVPNTASPATYRMDSTLTPVLTMGRYGVIRCVSYG